MDQPQCKGRKKHLLKLLKLVQLENCSLNGIQVVLDTYQGLLDSKKVYKLLVTAMVQARQPTSTVVLIGEDYSTEEGVCWALNKHDQFEKLCDIPDYNNCGCSACTIPGGFIVTGGDGSKSCTMFMASTKTWIRLENMPRKRCDHGSVCMKGVLFVIGGNVQGTDDRNSVECLSFLLGRWESGPDMPYHMLPDVAEMTGDVYVLDAEGDQLLCLDFDKKEWSSKSSVPLPADEDQWMRMVSAHGRLYAAWNKLWAWYTPETDTWCIGQSLLKLRHDNFTMCGLVHLKNRLLFLKGSSCDYRYAGYTVEECNLEDHTWSVSAITEPRSLLCSHVVVVDNVLL